MTTSALIALLQELDPRGVRTVKISATGFKGGIGSSMAKYPSIATAHSGFDHDDPFILLSPEVALKKSDSA